jgi:hypothetical protein
MRCQVVVVTPASWNRLSSGGWGGRGSALGAARTKWRAFISLAIARFSNFKTMYISAGVSAPLSQASAKARERSAASRLSGLLMLPSAAATWPRQVAPPNLATGGAGRPGSRKGGPWEGVDRRVAQERPRHHWRPPTEELSDHAAKRIGTMLVRATARTDAQQRPGR